MLAAQPLSRGDDPITMREAVFVERGCITPKTNSRSKAWGKKAAQIFSKLILATSAAYTNLFFGILLLMDYCCQSYSTGMLWQLGDWLSRHLLSKIKIN